MARTPAAAVAVAKRITSKLPPGMCLQFTRECFGIGSGFGSAAAAWRGAQKRYHVTRGADVPAGVPVFWLGGSRGFGHSAVSLGNGLCRSTDWPRSGQVGTVAIDTISRTWNQRLVGYTEDINETPIPGVRKVIDAFRGKGGDEDPDISLANVIRAVRTQGAIKHGVLLKAAVAKEVGKGRMNMASPVLGRHFRTQYRLVQKEFLAAKNRKVTTTAADGIPGMESLRWLGSRQGFDAIS